MTSTTTATRIKLKQLELVLGESCLSGLRIQKLLGSGAHGVVYAACDLKRRCHYAVKVQLLQNRYAIHDFAVEVAFTKLASIHEFGPRLYVEHVCPATCLPNGLVCVAKQKAPPGPRRRRSSAGIKVGIVVMEQYTVPYGKMAVPRPYRQLMARLVAAHKQSIVHSDLMPGNVMVKDGDVVKLIDWGLSFSYHRDTKPSSPLSFRTRSSMFKNWYKTALVDYMVPYYKEFYKQRALNVTNAILQWGIVHGGGFDYTPLLLRAKNKEEQMKDYVKRLHQPHHLVVIDWALPYTEWLVHGGIPVKVQLSEASTGHSKGGHMTVYVNKQDSLSNVRKHIHTMMHFHDKYKQDTEAFSLRGTVLNTNATLAEVGYKEDDVLLETIAVEAMQEE